MKVLRVAFSSFHALRTLTRRSFEKTSFSWLTSGVSSITSSCLRMFNRRFLREETRRSTARGWTARTSGSWWRSWSSSVLTGLKSWSVEEKASSSRFERSSRRIITRTLKSSEPTGTLCDIILDVQPTKAARNIFINPRFSFIVSFNLQTRIKKNNVLCSCCPTEFYVRLIVKIIFISNNGERDNKMCEKFLRGKVYKRKDFLWDETRSWWSDRKRKTKIDVGDLTRWASWLWRTFSSTALARWRDRAGSTCQICWRTRLCCLSTLQDERFSFWDSSTVDHCTHRLCLSSLLHAFSSKQSLGRWHRTNPRVSSTLIRVASAWPLQQSGSCVTDN